ncbi:MAG: NfeD family protein [Eubacteriales bacterium]|nr:NfeD family protein [Eubacteriales bacterium]
MFGSPVFFGWITPVYFWLLVLIICLVAEAVTVQLVTIWFATGAVGALLAANFGLGLGVQLTIFVLLSVVLLLPLRPLMRKALYTGRSKTNADRILDQTAVVVQTINNREESGQIRLMGQVWTARSLQENDCIPEGETVIVRSISGVKAMVERCGKQ